jgi:hypothetical protein
VTSVSTEYFLVQEFNTHLIVSSLMSLIIDPAWGSVEWTGKVVL